MGYGVFGGFRSLLVDKAALVGHSRSQKRQRLWPEGGFLHRVLGFGGLRVLGLGI